MVLPSAGNCGCILQYQLAKPDGLTGEIVARLFVGATNCSLDYI